jgi:Holliday junction resolvasome RuvABC endonuclease subunit
MTKSIAVIGLDLSLRRTGIAEADGTVRALNTKEVGVTRLLSIRNEIEATVERAWNTTRNVWAVLEGYSYGSPAQLPQLGELGGVVRVALHEANTPFIVVAPGTLKKYATGKGNAGKPEVVRAAAKRLGYDGFDDNEADALWLRALGLDWLGLPEVDVPALNRTALKAVDR